MRATLLRVSVFWYVLLALWACEPRSDEPVDIVDKDAAPAWSNAGDRIAFTRLNEGEDSLYGSALYVVDTTGNSERRLSIGGLSSTWLAGDTEIVFFKTNFKLYLININTMQESLLCDCIDSRYSELSADGSTVYYEDQGVADNWATSIYALDLFSGETTHVVGGSVPSASPDGRYLLVSRRQVYRYDRLTDSQVVIFYTGNAYDWSPAVDSVLVGNSLIKEEQNKIYKMDIDGKGAHFFMEGRWPQYSPTGNRIAFARISSDGRERIWLINPDGTEAKQITR